MLLRRILPLCLLLAGSPAIAQDIDLACYMVTASGQVFDLGRMCSSGSSRESIPVSPVARLNAEWETIKTDSRSMLDNSALYVQKAIESSRLKDQTESIRLLDCYQPFSVANAPFSEAVAKCQPQK